MDFNVGQVALLQALTLLKDENELSIKISNLMDSVNEDKARAITLLCEALAMHKQEVDKKKKIVEILEEITKWWSLLVEDREKLLLTISNLELEKEMILKKQSDPKEIYGPALKAETTPTPRKKPRLMKTLGNDDDFVETPNKNPVPVVISLDA